MIKKMTTHRKARKQARKTDSSTAPTLRETCIGDYFFYKEKEHPCYINGMEGEAFVVNIIRMYWQGCCLGAYSTSVHTGRTRTYQAWSKSFIPAIRQLTSHLHSAHSWKKKLGSKIRLLLFLFNDTNWGNRSQTQCGAESSKNQLVFTLWVNFLKIKVHQSLNLFLMGRVREKEDMYKEFLPDGLHPGW